MVARGVVGVVGCSLVLLAWSGTARAQAAQFPTEQAQAPAASAAPPAATTTTPSAAPPTVATPAAAPTTGPATPAAAAPESNPSPAPGYAPPPPVYAPPRPVEVRPPSTRTEVVALRRKPASSWNVGAGVSSSGDSMAQVVLVPGYRAALERRLGQRSWLALNALGGYERRDTPLQLSENARGGRTQVQTYDADIAVFFGLRYAFVQGVVEVSLLTGVFGSYEKMGRQKLRSGETAFGTLPGSIRKIGIVGGLAVERELVEALGLRLSLDMVSASISSVENVSTDDIGFEKTTDSSAHGIGLAIRPSLALHFYF
jgi:hypothetical protein